MAITGYKMEALIGGAVTALDGIDGDDLFDGDFAWVLTGPGTNTAYLYILDDDSGAAEGSPLIIAPDNNPGTKRWILQFWAVSAGGTGTQSLTDGALLVGAGTSAIEAIAVGGTNAMLVGGGASTNPVWIVATGSGAPVRANTPT